MRPEDLPTTWPQVHDLLQQMFGIGTYDSIARPDPPWHRTRMNEISRLKSMGTKRHARPEQVGMAAWFAVQTGVHVRKSHLLFPLIPKAQVAWNRAQAEAKQEEARLVMDDLIAEALEAGESQWAERFIRASPAELPALIEKWRDR